MNTATLRESIIKRKQTPISYNDILKALQGHAKPKFYMLDDLPDKPTDLFGDNDSILILCTMHSMDGAATKINHWVSFFKHDKDIIFFDSLGQSVAELTARLHTKKHSLINWARGKRIRENKTRLQKWDSHTNTCGAHQAVRLIKRKLNNRQYVNWLKHGFLNPDLSVCMLCWSALIHASG